MNAHSEKNNDNNRNAQPYHVPFSFTVLIPSIYFLFAFVLFTHLYTHM